MFFTKLNFSAYQNRETHHRHRLGTKYNHSTQIQQRTPNKNILKTPTNQQQKYEKFDQYTGKGFEQIPEKGDTQSANKQ